MRCACGVAQVVRFVHDDEGIVVQFPAGVGLVVAPGEAQLVVRHRLDPARKAVLLQERLPHALLERGRRQDENPLAKLFDGLANHLGGDERLSQPDLVGDQDAAVRIEQPQQSLDAVALEAGQLELLRRCDLLVGCEIPAVQLPQHAQEDEPGRVRIPARCVKAVERVLLGPLPEVLEPVLDKVSVRPGWIAEIEFGVRHESREGQVRRTGKHGALKILVDQERLAVQETLGEAAHFDAPEPQVVRGLEPGHHSAGGAIRFPAEAGEVALRGEPGFVPA